MSVDDDVFWAGQRERTQARIGLGRTGDGLPTPRVLEFRAAHAVARDAVHQPVDEARLLAGLSELGLGEPLVVRSRAANRAEYLRRPDLGRLPESIAGLPSTGADIGIVLADGLSAVALEDHGVALVRALVAELSPSSIIAPPVVATQARVALGDHIGAALGVSTVLVLIGERPGLSVASSLGVYLTHLTHLTQLEPGPGVTDADRNCVSNIHPPEGLGYAAAARVVAGLVHGARALGRSGVDLKDTSREALLPGSGGALVACPRDDQSGGGRGGRPDGQHDV